MGDQKPSIKSQENFMKAFLVRSRSRFLNYPLIFAHSNSYFLLLR